MTALMSDKQRNYLKILMADRPRWTSGMADLADADRFDILTLDEASGFISLALAVPKEKGPDNGNGCLPQKDIQEGSYWTEAGNVARVRTSRSSGRLYAEKLDSETCKFQYTRGLIFHLKARMTLDEARAWGSRHGLCCVCAKTLTDNRSVDQGIGPVCIKRV